MFEKIVEENHQTIDQLIELNRMKGFSQKLLSDYAVQELFEPKVNNLKSTQYFLSKGLFTKKQSELLSLLASGVTSYKAISKRMNNISLKTVEWHITELKKRTNASTKTELIQFAKKITV